MKTKPRKLAAVLELNDKELKFLIFSLKKLNINSEEQENLSKKLETALASFND